MKDCTSSMLLIGMEKRHLLYRFTYQLKVNSNHCYYYERATLARATRVVIHSYLYSGLRPSVRGKIISITSDNGNLRNLRYIENICHVILTLIT